jgi:hypothetical protein
MAYLKSHFVTVPQSAKARAKALLRLETNPFAASYVNVPTSPGILADTKRLFCDGRYAVAPVHNRLGPDVVWFVWDAYNCDSLGYAKVIRQEDSFEEAVAGL